MRVVTGHQKSKPFLLRVDISAEVGSLAKVSRFFHKTIFILNQNLFSVQFDKSFIFELRQMTRKGFVDRTCQRKRFMKSFCYDFG